MKVSELADKYGVKATELVANLDEYGLRNLSPADFVPADDIKGVETFLKGKGYTSALPPAAGATLIKKTSPAEAKPAQAVARVKKKIVIKRKHVRADPDKKAASAAPAVPQRGRTYQGNRALQDAAARPQQDSRPPQGGRAGPTAAPAAATGGDKKKSRGHGREKSRAFSSRRHREQEREIHYKNKKRQQQKSALESVPKQIEIMEVVTVGELARKMNLKANEIIAKLMQLGVLATINQQIDSETATLVAAEFSCEVKTISLYEETLIEEVSDKKADLIHRPPIVTVMGHVDHGKTKLLDAIRSANVVDSESGGITQHIGAYQVAVSDSKVTFLDTPGHEAFTMMRARGASVTDIVILVVAADDGIMPQTIEAIDHAKEARVPIVVAINKMDKPEANIDRVKQQLSEHSLLAEDWGGDVMCIPVSALQKTGIKELLEGVLLQAEILELEANPNKGGVGSILEARVDQGKGTVATVLCQSGSITVGDNFVAGIYNGKVRAMFNDKGENVKTAEPAMPVEVLGFSGLPEAGDPFHILESDRKAKLISSKRRELKRFEDARNVKKVTMENLFDRIQAGEMKELKVVIKADVQGSSEALRDTLEKIENDQVRLVCIHNSAGAINERDVMLAAASDAIVVGFHVRPNSRAKEVAEKEKVDIRLYSVIYDAINDIEAAITGLMAPELHEQINGSAEIRDLFKVPKIGLIAGSYVTEGEILRGSGIRIIREGVEIYDGKISSLKRFKDDVKEVKKGYECGIGVENYHDLKLGDILESYSIKEVRPGSG